MRKLLITGFFIAAAAAGHAQTYGLYQTCTLQNGMGQAISNAQVYFMTQPANTQLLTPLAPIFSSSSGGVIMNPTTTNGRGTCTAYLAPGLYTVCYLSPATGKVCFADQNISLVNNANIAPGAAVLGSYPTSPAQQIIPSNIGIDAAGNNLTVPANLTAATATASADSILYIKAPPYNAVCDGTTDDQTAIQATFTDAAIGSTNPLCTAYGCQVQFPAGACKTSTIVYKGQPFFGSGMLTSIIQGMPGQDVFHTADSVGNLPQSTHIHDIKIIVDGSVNASATAGGGNNTFPNRITGTAGGTTALPSLVSGGPPAPGQAHFGAGGGTGSCSASVTAGSAVLTATCQSFANAPPPTMINQPITVNGAGTQTAITAWSITTNVATFTATNSFTAGQSVFLNAFGTSTFFNNQYATVIAAGLSGSQFEVAFTHANGSATEAGSAGGSPLTTTILSTTGNTVTMAANSLVTGTVMAGSWGTPWSTPWYIGNCGMAIPHSDQNVSIGGPNGWTFTNVYFYSTNYGANVNNYKHECGLFMQAQPYNLHFSKVNFQGMWMGYAEALPAQNFTSSIVWTPDTSTYDDLNFSATQIAMAMFNGAHRTMKGSTNIYTANQPFSLGLWDFVYGNNVASLDIDHYYHETWSSDTGEISRIGGSKGNIKGGSLSQSSTYPPPFDQYMNVTGSANKINAQVASLHVAGDLNVTNNLYPGSGNNGYFVDTGSDNELGTYYSSSGQNRRFVLNRARDPLNKADACWLTSGNSLTPFTSCADLVATCPELNFAFAAIYGAPGCTSDQGTSVNGYVIPDPGNIYGSYVHTTVANNPSGWTFGNGASGGTGPVGKQFTIGDRLPQGVVNVVIIARCDAACTQLVTIKDSRTNATITSATLSFGTTWTVQSVPNANLASGTLVGDVINVVGGVSTGAGVTYEDVQVIGFQPVNTDTLAAAAVSPAVQKLAQVAAAGNVNLNCTNWTWGTTATDATSPTGCSSTVANSSSISAVSGFANLNGGNLYPAVNSKVSVLISGPTIWTDTLGGAMLVGDTTMTITTPVTATWPGCGTACTNAYLQIGQEIVKVTAPTVGATVLTITRAQFGTLAQAHSNGAAYTSVGQGAFSTLCNATTYSSTSVVFTSAWAYTTDKFSAQNCSGYATTFKVSGIGADFTGQVYKFAAVVIEQQPSLPTPTAASLVPLSAAANAQFAYTATKAITGAGAALTTGPTSTTTLDVATYTGTAGQLADSGKVITGAGAAVVSGPTTSVATDVVTYSNTTGAIADSGTLLTALAPKASPAFTGTPTSVTLAVTTNNTNIATTSAVTTALASYAPLASPTFTGTVTLPLLATTTNCASGASPAVCSAAPAGAVAMPTGVNPTLVINTTAVTASSRIMLTVDDSVTIGGTTCNSTLATLVGGMAITARTAATSFTVSYNGTITTNPLCFSYRIIN